MSLLGHHVILCEGFDDRSFWSGWLQHLECVDPTDGGKNKKARDANGDKVVGKGRFLFYAPGNHSIVLQPYGGKDNLSRFVDDELVEHIQKPRTRVILNLDSDAKADDLKDKSAEDSVVGILRNHGVTVTDLCSGFVNVKGIEVAAVIWQCDDPSGSPGVPRKQTLERLVCASIQAAYPERGRNVMGWLSSEPKPESLSHKNYSLSYLAKWYASFGADDFFRAIWRDEEIAQELEKRLRATGAWGLVETLAR